MAFAEIRRGVRRLFRLGVRSRRLARRDAAEELRSILAAREEQLRALGYSPSDARAEAVRRMGGDLQHALDDVMRSAEHREDTMSMRETLSEMVNDLRLTMRGLRRDPRFGAFVVVTLALGIGANAAMFGVADRLLVQGPGHVVQPDRVMRVYRHYTRANGEKGVTSSYGWVLYDILRSKSRSFAGVAGYSVGYTIPLGRGAGAELIPVGAATYDLFPMLGVRPELGRFFNAQEDSPDAPQHVLVLSHGLWIRAFGGDANVLGRKVMLGDESYIVIGVAPRGFTGPVLTPTDVWYPMSLHSRDVVTNWTKSWNAQWMQIIVRLKGGITPTQAADDATAALRAGYSGTSKVLARSTITFGSLRSTASGNERVELTVSRWLVGVAAVVLLIACSNVANLLLARAARRRQELAVRIALGSGRGRLVRLVFTECLVLAGLAGAAGLAVTWTLTPLMRSALLPDIEWTASPVGWRIIVASAVLAVVVGALIGVAPALRAARADLSDSLKTGVREGGGRTWHARSMLTIAQAALSVVLLVGAGAFVRSLMNVRSLDLGIQPDRVLVTQLRYPTNASVQNPKDAPEHVRRAALLVDLMTRTRRIPGVERASLTIGLPFQYAFGQSLRVPGWDSIPRLKGGNDPFIAAVAPDYFETVGTRILEGRGFTNADRAGSEPVAVVNKTMATILWRGRSPIGDCLYWGVSTDSLNVCSRIVGVAADANNSRLREDPTFVYYVPFGQEKGFGGSSLVVRPRPGAEGAVTKAVRDLVLTMDPSVTFVKTSLLQDEVDPQMRPWKLGATVFTLLGALAALVAAIGLYSVMSYLVAQRRRELGVRIALGARTSNIVRLVFRSGIGMVTVGVVIGVVASLWGGRFLAPLLFDTSPHDPAIIGGVVALLLVVGVLASVVPALRAARVDPTEALRSE
jgi:predicted permease